MKITLEKLVEMNACREAREEFAKRFPHGTTANQITRECPRGDWLICFLWNFKLATIEQIIMIGCVGGRRSLRFARPKDVPVLVAAYDAADAVADDNTEQSRSAAWSAESAARSAALSAESAESAEHLAIANDMRTMMCSPRYRKAGAGRE